MTLLFQSSTTAVLFAVSLASAAATEPEAVPPEMREDYRVPLSDADLQAIKLEVVRQFPMLSSSPGIKFAEGHHVYYARQGQPVAPGVAADVIFQPHAESAGTRYAIQAHCQRDDPAGDWTCPGVELRRYVKLDSQDFEVRVKADLDLAGVLAVIEATRGIAATADPSKSAAMDTASMILSCDDGYLVAWGTRDFTEGLTVKAKVRDGGDPAKASDWEVHLLPES